MKPNNKGLKPRIRMFKNAFLLIKLRMIKSASDTTNTKVIGILREPCSKVFSVNKELLSANASKMKAK